MCKLAKNSKNRRTRTLDINQPKFNKYDLKSISSIWGASNYSLPLYYLRLGLLMKDID